jgi:hypothetical protein
MTGTDWENELRELIRKLKEHVVTVEQYTAERRRLAPAPNATVFAAEEERLFSVALDIEASAEAIYARAEGCPMSSQDPRRTTTEKKSPPGTATAQRDRVSARGARVIERSSNGADEKRGRPVGGWRW